MSDLGICRTFFQRIVQVFEVIQAHADKAGLWEQLWRWSPLSQVQPPSRPPPPSLTVSWRTRVHSSPPTLFQTLHSFSSAGTSGGRESGPVWMVGGPDQEEHLHLQLIVAPLLAPRVPATWRRFHLLHYRTCGATPQYALTLSNSFSTMPQLNDLSLSHCLFIMTTLLAENAQPRKSLISDRQATTLTCLAFTSDNNHGNCRIQNGRLCCQNSFQSIDYIFVKAASP